MIAAIVDIELDGFFREDMGETRRTMVLARWCDELENWPPAAIRGAFAKWIRENTRRPNYGDILRLLKEAWGRQQAPAVRAALAKPRAEIERASPERRAAQVAELEQIYPILKRVPVPLERAPADQVAQQVSDVMKDDSSDV